MVDFKLKAVREVSDKIEVTNKQNAYTITALE